MGVSFFGLILLLMLLLVVALCLAGLVALTVAAIKKKSPGLGIAAALLGLLFVVSPLVMVFALFMARATSVATPRATGALITTESRSSVRTGSSATVTVSGDSLGVATAPAEVPAEWRPAFEILPDAEVDFYPSQREAIQKVAAAIRAHGAAPVQLIPAETTGSVQIQPLADALTGKGLHCWVKKSDRELLDGGVQNPDTSPSGTRRLTVRWVEPHQGSEDSPIGSLTVRNLPDASDLPWVISVRFVDKPWLTNLSAHRLTANAPDLVTGFSTQLESSAQAAETAALRAVAAKLAPRIAEERSPRENYDPGIRYPELNSVVRNLRRFSLIQDRFTQQLERDYGTVYRHAVLVDATPQTIKRLYNGGNGTWTSLPVDQQLAQGQALTPVDPFEGFNTHIEGFNTQIQGFNSQIEGLIPTEFESPSDTRSRSRSLNHRGLILFRVLGLGVLIGITLLIYRVLDRWTLGYRQGTLTVTAVAVVLGGAALLGLLLVA